MIWVEKSQIVSMHSELIEIFGGIDGMRDERFLDSALEAPFLTFNEQELFPSIIEKAARLAYGLTYFHPFIDGNKRIGKHALVIVLAANDIELTYTQKEVTDIFYSVASGGTGYSELLEWTRNHISPN